MSDWQMTDEEKLKFMEQVSKGIYLDLVYVGATVSIEDMLADDELDEE